jgi:MFS family permease
MLIALRHADFRRLMASEAVSQVGDWLYNVALAVYVFDRTHSAAWVGAMTLLRLVPYVLFAPIGGVIADRYERRAVLIYSDLLRMLVMGLLAVSVATNAPVLLIGFLALATTAAGTAYTPATSAFVPELVAEADLASANSLESFVQGISIVVGPGLGALLLALTTPTWCFVVNTATFALGALISLRIRTRGQPRVIESGEERRNRFGEELSEGAQVVRDRGDVRVLISLGVGTQFIYGAQTVILVILAGERVGHDASNVGFLYGALGVGGVIGAPVAARLARHARIGALALTALVCTSVAIVALIPVHEAYAAAALTFFVGIGQVVVEVITITMLQRNLERDVVGRVFGIGDALAVGAMILGSLLVAPFVSAFGFGPMLVLIGGLALAPVLIQMASLVNADRDSAFEWAHRSRIVADLSRVSLFSSLHAAALELLADRATKERFAVGETIIAKGDQAEHCYTVLHGEVAVRAEGPTSEIIGTLHEDDFFGEIGLLHHTARTASVTAASDCVLYVIDADTFAAALDADASVGAVALEVAGRRLSALGAGSR